jgi:hypothetical protein
VPIAKLGQGRHIVRKDTGRCGPQDATVPPDVNNCPTRGVSVDLFPSTVVYITATIVDPAAKHWDPSIKQFVTGPLASRLYYQVRGRHPDLNRNGIDDYIDTANGTSKDANRDGVPDEVQRCLSPLRALEACEVKERNLKVLLTDARKKDKSREAELEKALNAQSRECASGLQKFKGCIAKR